MKNKKKILFIATYGDFLSTFELSNIQICLNKGLEVHCASNFLQKEYNRYLYRLEQLGVKKHQIAFSRNPLDIHNAAEYKKMVFLFKKERFDVIDCHNPVPSAYGRMAAKRFKNIKVIYTAHGFSFKAYSNSLKDTLFRFIERYLSKSTDLLITINQDDYELAKTFPIHGRVEFIPGVGIDTHKISTVLNKRKEYCEKFGIGENGVIFLSVGELIPRKNHKTAIQAMIKAKLQNVYYLIAGQGVLKNELEHMIIRNNAQDYIKVLGYRTDVLEIMKSVDVFLFPSFQEGLSVALMEAMAAGKPCLASNIRGNRDLIDDEKGGYLFDPHDENELIQTINRITEEKDKFEDFGRYNRNKILFCDIKKIQIKMEKMYNEILK